MADTSIQWTAKTWNPVSGCTRDSRGCDNCYAVRMSHRLERMGQSKYAGLTAVNQRGDRHFNGVVRTHDDDLLLPLRWKKSQRVFVNSMSDLFHKDVPFEFIDRVFAVMALCPHLTFQVLTKRPERMAEYLAIPETQQLVRSAALPYWPPDGYRMDEPFWMNWALPNVWLGTSCEDQEAADERIPHLLRCPAAVRFLSCEPLLGPVNLRPWILNEDADHLNPCGCGDGECSTCWQSPATHNLGLDWVIVGGESGPGARPCVVGHIRELVQQCAEAEVPCFVKQLGSRAVYREGKPYYCEDRAGGDPEEWPQDLRVRQFPKEAR